MLSFLRNDLNQLQAYAPHPGGNSGSPIETQILDRLDTNECPVIGGGIGAINKTFFTKIK